MIFRSPLPKLHYYHNKRLQARNPSTLPTYSWTLTPIPNWTCFVVTVPLSDARLPSMWLTVAQIPINDFKTPTKKIVGYKALQFIHTMKIKKMLGHKTLWCKYIATSSRERDKLGRKLCLRSQFAWTKFAQCLCNLCTVLRLLKRSFFMSKVRRKEGPKIDSQILTKLELDSEILTSTDRKCREAIDQLSSFNKFALFAWFLEQTWRLQHLILKCGFLKYLNTS